MSTTITAWNGAGSTTPLLVLGYETTLPSRNRIFDTIGGSQVVSVIRPRPRTGILQMLYSDETEAFACVALHKEETQFALASTDRPLIDMDYFVGEGDIELELEDGTRELWIVRVPFFAASE